MGLMLRFVNNPSFSLSSLWDRIVVDVNVAERVKIVVEGDG